MGKRPGFSVEPCEPELPSGAGSSLGPLEALPLGKAGQAWGVQAEPHECLLQLQPGWRRSWTPFLVQREHKPGNIGRSLNV